MTVFCMPRQARSEKGSPYICYVAPSPTVFQRINYPQEPPKRTVRQCLLRPWAGLARPLFQPVTGARSPLPTRHCPSSAPSPGIMSTLLHVIISTSNSSHFSPSFLILARPLCPPWAHLLNSLHSTTGDLRQPLPDQHRLTHAQAHPPTHSTEDTVFALSSGRCLSHSRRLSSPFLFSPGPFQTCIATPSSLCFRRPLASFIVRSSALRPLSPGSFPSSPNSGKRQPIFPPPDCSSPPRSLVSVRACAPLREILTAAFASLP